ncbi:MAG: hypothetical protein KF773_32950 [Deltaproteobacteria bacterium]|nr:hypothetical protein [Deltaproteobacteria bacterium]MCW5801079.1 hypothetical protein [Deltaproteobacteria bacterium]
MTLTSPHRLAPLVGLLGTATLLAACLGNVGGGGSERGTNRGGDDDDGRNCKELTSGVTIRSASDFDTLPKGCWDLFGKLTIQGRDITSLAKLGDLKGVNELELIGTNLTALDVPKALKVFGPVTVVGNTKLRSLDKLEVERADNLTMEITIDDNDVLADLGDMSLVARIDGDLTLTANPQLQTASLRGLRRIDGAIRVTDNAALTSFELMRLETVGRVEVVNNAKLASLWGMAATTIKGDLLVRGNRALTSLGAMSSLATIEGNFIVDDNDALTSIGGFTTSMQYVLGMVTVTNNAALTELGQIARLRGIGALTITDNASLSFCRAREVAVCVTTQGSITVQNNKVGNNCTSWCGR